MTAADPAALAEALLSHLVHVTNLPEWMQVPALGRDLRPLAEGLAEALLASPELARLIAAERAAALREAADWLEDECRGSTARCFCMAAPQLRERADETYRAEAEHE